MSTIFIRPDGRRFVSLRSVEPSDYTTAIASAVATGGTLHVHVDLANAPLVKVCTDAGFVVEMVSHSYDVPFPGGKIQQPRATSDSDFEISRADHVDPDPLFRLDECLRNDVPGLAGWVGDRDMFDGERASSSFDASGYLVARDRTSNELVGLIRFWRNDDGPSLGLLGVRRQFRGSFLSHRLLVDGMRAARDWGSPSFTTRTARAGLQRRIERMGGVRTGRFAQMIHHG